MRADQQLKCIHAPLVIREARRRRRARAEAPVALQGPGRCGDARDERGPSSCHTTHFTGVCCYLLPSIFNWIRVMRPKNPG